MSQIHLVVIIIGYLWLYIFIQIFSSLEALHNDSHDFNNWLYSHGVHFLILDIEKRISPLISVFSILLKNWEEFLSFKDFWGDKSMEIRKIFQIFSKGTKKSEDFEWIMTKSIKFFSFCFFVICKQSFELNTIYIL